MKAIFSISIMLISCLLFFSKCLSDKHPWLNSDLQELYEKRSIEYNVPLELALCVVQAESDGKNVRSKKRNKNGTYDYGRFQINSVHMPNNPERLLIDEINSKYGFWYLSLCLKKSKNYLPDAIRFYNQGIHGKKRYYKRWEYVEEILKCYNHDIIKDKQ